jgi:2'-5' RNA ligase
MNTFLALRLADGPRDRLARVVERLQAWELPAAWVHPEDLHLTVRFLGRLDPDESAAIPHAIDLVAGAVRQPRLRLAGLGAWGGRNEPRVVFAALEDTEAACVGMHLDLSAAVGMEPEREFAPHITLCRPKPQREAVPPGCDWPQLLEAHGQADWGACETTHLVLYCAESDRDGPRYRELASWPLCA